jgi:hypothetical protein
MMGKAKMVDIRLKEAEAKFTKAKAAVDGTPKAEASYQKAKTALAMARQAYAVQRHVRTSDGNGQATLKAVSVAAGNPKTRRQI